MSATSTSTRPATQETSAARPAGLGMAIVFLWGLAAQYTAQGIGGTAGRFGLHHGAGRMAAYLAGAVLLVALGEGLRRGMEWARFGTLALALLVVVLGVSTALVFVAGHGMPRRVVLSTVVELTLIPWIAWRLSLRRTASWFRASGGATAAAALTGWVLVATIVILRLATGGLRLPLPSGKPMAVAASAAIELVAVPLVALRLWLAPAPAAPTRGAGGTRVEGVWLAVLVAWAVPWGILIAYTQGIGLR
ncbi:MAG: hypothetical protein QOE72_1986 [Chloroflexota bacterium]|nr:hypothetical protein [Chloroflexota bacterium]